MPFSDIVRGLGFAAAILCTASAQASSLPPRVAGPLTLRLGWGTLVDGSQNPVPEAILSADLDLLGRFGLALSGSLAADATTQDAADATAFVTLHRQSAALAARFALFTDGAEDGLRLYAGVALTRIGFNSTGYSFSPGDDVTYNPALLVSALWQQKFWDDLSGFAQVSALFGQSVGATVEEFGGALATVATVSPVLIELSLGLGFEVL